MDYPIVEVHTSDNIELHGLLSQPARSQTLFLNIHGSGSNFFCEAFEPIFYAELPKQGVDVLFTNNRGSYALESWQDTGAAIEIFEESILDIDAWIEWALHHHYTKIILSGHSHGTEKVIYYMNKGRFKDKVSALVIMGFCDSVGTQKEFEKTISVDLMAEAQEKIKRNRGYELLTGHRRAQAGELPISAQTYINYFSKGSVLSTVTPFRNNSALPMIRSIHVPILATIGDHEEYTIIPVSDAMKLLKSENPSVESHQIVGSGHVYEGYQTELINIVKTFIGTHLNNT